MAVVIRLTKIGRKGEGRYRVILREKRSRRDGEAIEILGSYTKTAKGETKKIDNDRVSYWLSQGAIPSPTVKKLLNI